uniref:Sperm nuclear basic protein PL-I n=1 Tax=Mesocestoides corti TaxID=53468 RepID=A0A5K3FH72_MESCO
MTSHLRQLEEKERRRQAELLQMGVIKKNPAALQPADATIIKGVKGLGGQRKAKRKGPMALRIIDYLDNPRMDVTGPDLSQLTMKELYSRAGEILKTICIEKEKSQEDEEQVDEEKRPQRFPHRLLREKPAAPP